MKGGGGRRERDAGAGEGRRRDEREDGMLQEKTQWPNTPKSPPVIENFNFSMCFYPRGSVS